MPRHAEAVQRSTIKLTMPLLDYAIIQVWVVKYSPLLGKTFHKNGPRGWRLQAPGEWSRPTGGGSALSLTGNPWVAGREMPPRLRGGAVTNGAAECKLKACGQTGGFGTH